ncbi:hypothetical protein HHI36_004433 [Cryptolaemus montrouzieri]|uniref:Uncharacterized protein n=1 Tax=Cryptolaemus montrouzieri TaxID=559131 RepID=A0ABD2NRH3_9CUCU
MKKLLWTTVVSIYFVMAVSALGNDDKFIKKFAMMKIYESCLGTNVLKQIQNEIRQACKKCASYEKPAPTTERPLPRPVQTTLPPQEAPLPENGNSLFQQQPFDQEKLNQAILAFRPNPFGTPQYRPYSPVSGFYPFNNPMYQTPLFYPAYQQTGQFSPYTFPLVGQPYMGGNRMSRDMDTRNPLFEAVTSRMSGKPKNMTCIMQELGYLDENLEPDYDKISERIKNLPVPEALREDVQDGFQFCKQFSQCVPQTMRPNSLLSRELTRPVIFFKCYQHKKIEACIMKDFRERINKIRDEEDDDDDDDEDDEGKETIIRQGKSTRRKNEPQIDAMATDVFEFLLGTNSNLELDSYL